MFFLFGILIHEAGHLLGGLITGYRFLFIEILGLTLEKKEGSLRLRVIPNSPPGQCLMYHENLGKCAIPLIIGGIAANLIFGLAGIAVFYLCEEMLFVLKLVFLAEGLINILLVLMNVFGNATSDWWTFTEVLRNKNEMKLYNGILLIYRYHYIDDGKIPDILKERLRTVLSECRQDGRKTGLETEAELLIK